MNEPQDSTVNDFWQLFMGTMYDMLNAFDPGCTKLNCNSPEICAARGRLTDLYGEDAMVAYERELRIIIRKFGDCNYADGKATAQLKRGSLASLEAALTKGFDQVKQELRRPKKALYDDKGNLTGSASADAVPP